MTPRLDELLNRARLAVLGRGAGFDQTTPALPTIPELTRLVVHRESIPAVPLVRVRAESLPPPLPVPSWPSLEVVMAGTILSRGAALLFALLYSLAVRCAVARGYSAASSSVVMHIPAQLVALGLGIGRTTLYRYLPELVDAGLLAYGAQAQKVGDMGLYGGVLWCVKTSTAEAVPRLTRADWKTLHRDFAGDMESGRTVKALVAELEHLQGQEQTEGYRQALESWPMRCLRPLPPVDDVGVPQPSEGLLEVAYRLGDLHHVHPTRLQEAVTEIATALALALHDPAGRAWYCKLLHEGLEAERQGRAGLAVLAAQLVRVHHDVQDWTELRNPAALLTSRLRTVA